MLRYDPKYSFSRGEISIHKDCMFMQAQDFLTERNLRDNMGSHLLGTVLRQNHLKCSGVVLLKRIPAALPWCHKQASPVPSNTALQDADSNTVTVSRVIYENLLVAPTEALSTPYRHRGTKH